MSFTLLTEGAFREGTFEGRSRGGARARRICAPLPGGPGPLMAARSSGWTLIDSHSVLRHYSLTEIAQLFHCCLGCATYVCPR